MQMGANSFLGFSRSTNFFVQRTIRIIFHPKGLRVPYYENTTCRMNDYTILASWPKIAGPLTCFNEGWWTKESLDLDKRIQQLLEPGEIEKTKGA